MLIAQIAMRQWEKPQIVYFLFFLMEKSVIYYGMLNRVLQVGNTSEMFCHDRSRSQIFGGQFWEVTKNYSCSEM